MTQAVKRACDACHRRKVKCDGINPCRNCSAAQLSCTYNAIPQKKGPKGSRAKVISELRENQKLTSLHAKVQSRISGAKPPPLSPSLLPSPGMLPMNFVKDCVNYYFDNLYSQMPILNRYQIEQDMMYMEQNRETYCLLISLCAFILLQPGMNMPQDDTFNLDMNPGAPIIGSQVLVEEALRVRKSFEYQDSIDMNALATNFFIFASYYGLEMHDKAWYYLREATTMIHIAGLHKEECYGGNDVAENERKRRLYWLFLMHERAYAIHRHRPLTLQASINLPTLGDDLNDPYAPQYNSFIMLVNIYAPFDEALITTWNNGRRHLSAQGVTGKQKEVNGFAHSYSCQDPNFSEIRTNQAWLKNTIWQLSNGSIGGHGDDSISFQYPVEMARELLMNMVSHFPNQGMDIVGSGLIEKLFETCYAMTEILAMQPPTRDPFTVGPRQHLNQLLNIVAVIRHGEYSVVPLLLSKVSEVLPRLVNPMLQNAPESTMMANMANIDIFDGFGTAGMAQPPPQMQMPMNVDYGRQKFGVDDYEKKFSVEEYEKKYSMDMGGGTPESASNSHASNGTPVTQQGPDINGSFVNSPGVMSPGVDYSQNMNGFGCTPMSDMVISPLANPGQSNPMNGMGNQHMPQQVGQVHDPLHQAPLGGMTTQGMHSQGMNSSAMPTSHSMNGMYGLHQARQGNFQMQAQQSMRTVGDFQGLQRAGSDTGMGGMNAMPNEIGFGNMR